MSQRLSVIPARAIEDDRLSKGDLKVLNALGVYADKEGWSFPSQKTLADKINMTRMSVSRAIKKLCDYGYIASENNFRNNGSQSSNKYRVLFDLPPLIHNGELSGCNIDVVAPHTTEMLHRNSDIHNKNVTPPDTPYSNGCNIGVIAHNGELSGCNINVVAGVTCDVTPITTQEELLDNDDRRRRENKKSIQEIFQWLEKHFSAPHIFYIRAPIDAWLSWGADFEKDIKPVAESYKAKYPDHPPKSLAYLDDRIARSIKQRNKPMPQTLDNPDKSHNTKTTPPLSQAMYISIKNKIKDGHTFVTPQEQEFVRKFEKQELSKV